MIVELKQWESARRTDMDGLVRTHFAEGEANTSHPSYQSWSYAKLLRSYNETVDQDQVPLQPSAYLHNCQEGGDLLLPLIRACASRKVSDDRSKQHFGKT